MFIDLQISVSGEVPVFDPQLKKGRKHGMTGVSLKFRLCHTKSEGEYCKVKNLTVKNFLTFLSN